jgi:hypothetical protein
MTAANTRRIDTSAYETSGIVPRMENRATSDDGTMVCSREPA